MMRWSSRRPTNTTLAQLVSVQGWTEIVRLTATNHRLRRDAIAARMLAARRLGMTSRAKDLRDQLGPRGLDGIREPLRSCLIADITGVDR